MPEYDIGSFPERLMFAPALRCRRPVRLLIPESKKRPLRRDTTQGSLFGAADGSRTHVLSLEG